MPEPANSPAQASIGLFRRCACFRLMEGCNRLIYNYFQGVWKARKGISSLPIGSQISKCLRGENCNFPSDLPFNLLGYFAKCRFLGKSITWRFPARSLSYPFAQFHSLAPTFRLEGWGGRSKFERLGPNDRTGSHLQSFFGRARISWCFCSHLRRYADLRARLMRRWLATYLGAALWLCAARAANFAARSSDLASVAGGLAIVEYLDFSR